MDFVTDCNDVIVVFGAAHVKIKSVSIFRHRTEAQRLHSRPQLGWAAYRGTTIAMTCFMRDQQRGFSWSGLHASERGHNLLRRLGLWRILLAQLLLYAGSWFIEGLGGIRQPRSQASQWRQSRDRNLHVDELRWRFFAQNVIKNTCWSEKTALSPIGILECRFRTRMHMKFFVDDLQMSPHCVDAYA
jgi:hypothetical protein